MRIHTNTNTRRTTDFARTFCPTTSHYLALLHSESHPPRRSHFFRTHEMANQSGSVSFQKLLESALLRYEKKTGVTLSKHPLALQLQSCNSVEDFNNVLQDKAKDIRESERITKSMRTIVSILTPLSSIASLPDTVGLVSYKSLMAASYSDIFLQAFPPAKAIQACLAVLLDVCAILWSICRFLCDTQVNQVGKGRNIQLRRTH